MAIFDLHAGGYAFTVHGEPTIVKGLYIATSSDVAAGKSLLGFDVAHAPTGRYVCHIRHRSVTDARSLVGQLFAIQADWTGLPLDMSEWPEGMVDAVQDVVNQHALAMAVADRLVH